MSSGGRDGWSADSSATDATDVSLRALGPEAMMGSSSGREGNSGSPNAGRVKTGSKANGMVRIAGSMASVSTKRRRKDAPPNSG